MKQVLDTRFLVEYLYSQNSALHLEVSRRIKELSESHNGIVPTMVLCELIQMVCSREGKDRAEMIHSSIIESGLKIESLTPSLAKEAGILKSTHKNIPTADCIIVATAIKNQARIISDDPHFDYIKEIKRTWL